MSGHGEDAKLDERAQLALRAALSSARQELPDDETMARMESKIRIALEGGGGPPPGGSMSRVARGAGILAIAAAGVLTWRVAPSLTTAPVTLPAPTPVEQVDAPRTTIVGSKATGNDSSLASGEEVSMEETRSHRRTRQPRVRQITAPPPSDPDSRSPSESPQQTIDEIAIIRAARRALASEPERALSLVETHQREFGAGILAEEREVLAIEALAALRRHPLAERRAEQFRMRWPASPYRSRIDAALTR